MPNEDSVTVMDVDTLYPLVTEAIRQAEALEARNDPDTRCAFSEVSRLEEHIAGVVPQSDYEGIIARRGAVRAAIKAHQSSRALDLITRFEAEEDVDAELRSDLGELKSQAIAIAVADQEKLVHLVGPHWSAEEVGDYLDAPALVRGAALDVGSQVDPATENVPRGNSRARLRWRIAFILTCAMIFLVGLALLSPIIFDHQTRIPSEVLATAISGLLGVYGAVIGFYFAERDGRLRTEPRSTEAASGNWPRSGRSSMFGLRGRSTACLAD